MTMFGARIGVNLQWLAAAPLALTVGTRFTLPLAGQASVSSGDTTLRSTVSATQNASSSEDLASALGLRKSGIGIEAMLGMALILP
jgi:type 1 fimbria pilin